MWSPARLKLLLRGDLDWIVMTAMEKDRNRRYQTAIGLGVDVRHYLNHEPVMARPPSRLYRFQKLVRRNRAVFHFHRGGQPGLDGGVWHFDVAAFQGTRGAARSPKGTRTGTARREARKGAERGVCSAGRPRCAKSSTKASSLVDKFQLAQADKLVGALPSSDTAKAGAAVFRPLGDWAAVQGNWRRAAEYYSNLVPQDMFKNLDSTTMDYTKYAVVLVAMGDRHAYENLCRDSIKQFGNTTDPNAAERIVKNSLLIPPRLACSPRCRPLRKWRPNPSTRRQHQATGRSRGGV